MRTLKKVLALSLVFAMAFTMMAGAAFKDQDKIDASLTNDIQLLTALGVFQGDENGNFNPTDNVKRSEAAKMIYVLKNNGVDDGAVAFQGVSKYSDVPVGHWAEGYINYCTNLGYMGGWKENGVQKFDPNGNVTGVELMKMLLCMIGYKADVQGYTGNGWQTNVLVDAATSGLSVEFVPSVYGATPRQWTARLMTNALDAKYVTYNKGELTYNDETYAEFALKLKTVEGVLKNAGKVALDDVATPGNVTPNENGDQIVLDGTTANPISPANAPTTFKTTVDASLLGQDVKVYYREGTTADTNKVYAVLATGDSKVYETTRGDVTVDVDGTNETIKFEGYNGGVAKKYADNVRHIYLVKNLEGTVTDVVAKSTANTNKGNFSALAGNSTAAIRFVDQDGDGYIDLAFTDATVYAKVSAYNADKNTLKLVDKDGNRVTLTSMTDDVNTAEEFEKLNIEGTIAENDVVATTVNTTSGKVVINVKKVEPVKASVAGYTLNTAGNAYATMKIDGTDYKIAANAMTGYTWATSTTVSSHDTFYTDGKYVVYSEGSSTVATIDNLAYVIATQYVPDGWGGNTSKVKVILSNGSVGTYTVAASYDQNGEKDSASDMNTLFNSSNGTAKDQIFTYSVNSDGKIVLNAIKTEADVVGNNATYVTNSTNKIDYTQKTGIATIGTTQYRTNDSTYFFVYNSTDDEYSVVKASELKADITNSTAKNMFVAQNVNGLKTLLVGVLNIGNVPTAKSQDYYFVTGSAYYGPKVDDKYVVTVETNAGGEVVTLTYKYDSENAAKTAMAKINGMKGKLVTVDLNSDGSVDTSKGTNNTGMTKVTLNTISSTINSTMWNKWYKVDLNTWNKADALADIEGQIVKIASDVKIFNVDVNDDGAKLVDGDSTWKSEDGQKSAAVYLNEDGEISVAFIEVDGMNIDSIAQ